MEEEVGRSYRPFPSVAEEETGAWGDEGPVRSRVAGRVKDFGRSHVCEEH